MTYEQIAITGQRFDLGKMVITRNALIHCEEHGIDYLELVMRHSNGDFGTVGHLDNANLTRAEKEHGAYMTDDGLKLNAHAIEHTQGMVLSVYPIPELKDSKIWIQTLLSGPDTYTTVLLPSEY